MCHVRRKRTSARTRLQLRDCESDGKCPTQNKFPLSDEMDRRSDRTDENVNKFSLSEK